MPVLKYDGSFEGFLCSLDYALRAKSQDYIFESLNKDPVLSFEEVVDISTNQEYADRFFTKLADKLSLLSAQIIMHAFLSEEAEIEGHILEYIKLAGSIGLKVNDHLSNESVLKVIKAHRRVGAEAHHYQGLLRFRKMRDEIYYASFEPKNNILCLLSQHFTDRFACQNWVIHDIKRSIALIYDGNTTEMVEVSDYNPQVSNLQFTDATFFAEEETELQDLWKGYFKSIAIKERINPNLQRQNMPKKYWKYLIEKS